MSFCYFCDPDAKKLKKRISVLEGEVKFLTGTLEYLKVVERVKNSKKGVPAFDQVFKPVPKNKEKIVKKVKEALIARNMTEGEADSIISYLTKTKP